MNHKTNISGILHDSTRASDALVGGLGFRRQYPLGGYILDFVCFRPKLVVEVDGGQHAESASDARRDAHFRENGFVVLRFWNDDVIRNLDGVCREILAAAGKRQ
ncbi:MAG TPA: endonuclease domain-containing protein [Rhizobiaceae bacterium]|nr:endonuclease domain-containing protein [Rhizobiaceae bacterium]